MAQLRSKIAKTQIPGVTLSTLLVDRSQEEVAVTWLKNNGFVVKARSSDPNGQEPTWFGIYGTSVAYRRLNARKRKWLIQLLPYERPFELMS